MLNIYLYNTATGQVLATAGYDERGDGAAARTLVLGTINPLTEYAPAGVKTARPVFSPALTIDKFAITADAVDSATISNIPAGTVAKIFKDGDSVPRAAATVNDGSLVLQVDTAGQYKIVLSNFPRQDTTFIVVAA
jgi:hypothetical protein